MVYLPPAFSETRTEVLIEHIERHEFGLLLSRDAYGTARTIADPVWLRGLLRRLTERHEAREPVAPWRMQDLPEAYLASMLNGIIGVEIAVTRLDGKFKLSQNRPAADRPRIIAALERRDDPDSRAVAQLMREREPAA